MWSRNSVTILILSWNLDFISTKWVLVNELKCVFARHAWSFPCDTVMDTVVQSFIWNWQNLFHYLRRLAWVGEYVEETSHRIINALRIVHYRAQSRFLALQRSSTIACMFFAWLCKQTWMVRTFVCFQSVNLSTISVLVSNFISEQKYWFRINICTSNN